MPIDTSSIDIKGLYERHGVALSGRKPSRAWKTGEDEYHGSCPWCGGRDRFMFLIPSGRYSCKIRASGCGRSGNDVITFLRESEGMSFLEACQALSLDPGSSYVSAGQVRRSAYESVAPPPETWRDRAAVVVQKAQQYLWSKQGVQALEYLHKRGFTDETVKRYQLGYIPFVDGRRWFKDALDLWGLTAEDAPDDEGVWLPEGILLPWWINGSIWKLNIRRLNGLRKGDAKYIQVTGSQEGLFNADTIDANLPVVLTESEFDAMIADQESAGRAAFVATGSVSRGCRSRWIARICMARYALIAFDDDANQAGERGAHRWLDVLPHAIRWLPWSHDLNEMFLAGISIQKWLETGMAVAETVFLGVCERQPTALQEGQETQEMPDPVVQVVASDQERAVSPAIPEVDACIVCGALTTDPRYEFFYVPLDQAHAVCYCENDYPGDTQEASILAHLHLLMKGVPELRGCEIHLDPPGYTITDRRRELAETNSRKARARWMVQPRCEACSCGSCEECRAREALLTWGETHGWPRLMLHPWLALPAGEAHWHGYAVCHSDRELHATHATATKM
ncbi:MAG TPA: hypothetical protein VEL31_06900 [Ktedonobacteraceae bacterium]|nr:hypothetical protein [Ktedonobacteraceae bacterium]